MMKTHSDSLNRVDDETIIQLAATIKYLKQMILLGGVNKEGINVMRKAVTELLICIDEAAKDLRTPDVFVISDKYSKDQ